MVQDGKVVGILDWEYAAFFPIWYEYVAGLPTWMSNGKDCFGSA
jgi:hypothetical protein